MCRILRIQNQIIYLIIQAFTLNPMMWQRFLDSIAITINDIKASKIKNIRKTIQDIDGLAKV